MANPPPDRVYINGHWYTVQEGSYQELDPSQLATKQYEGDPRYADFVNVPTFAQDDFSGGYGKKRYGLGDSDTRRDRTYRVENVDTSHPGIALPAFDVESSDVGLAVKQFIELGGEIYALGEQKCLKQSDFDTNVWAEDKDFGAGVDLLPGCAAIYSGTTATPKMYVGIGSGANFWYRDASSWSQHGSLKADLFAAVGGDDAATMKDLLLLATRPNVVKSSADGSTFGSAYYVGDADVDITSLFGFDEYWMVGKETGMHVIFSNGLIKVLNPDMLRNAENCQAVAVWGNVMWYNRGLGLDAFAGGELVNVGAEETMRHEVPTCDEGELMGRITCLLGGHQLWLFAVLKTVSGKHYLMKYDGNPEVGRGWHPVWSPGGTTAITALHWHQKEGENPRLMMGVGNSIAYMVFSEYSDDGLNDPACKFQVYGTVELPAHALNLPNIDKAFVDAQVHVLHRYLDGGAVVIGTDPDDETFVDVIYAVDDDEEQTLKRIRTTGLAQANFPIPTTGKWLMLKLGLGSDDASGEKCAFARLVLAEEEMILQAKREWQMNLLVGEGFDPREGRGLEKQLADLETARGLGPVDVTTLRGEEIVGIVTAAPKVQVKPNDKGSFRNAYWYVSVTIREYGTRQTLYYFDDENARFEAATFA